jgi:hypothetical protein
MKYLIILFTVIAFFNLNANAQVKLGSYAVRNSPGDLYPTHLDSLGQGGFMSLQTIANRNAILSRQRKVGMMVYVQANDSLYKLATADLSNNGWVAMGLLTQQKLSDSLNTRLKGTDTLSLSSRIDSKANVGNITDVNNELVLKLNIIDTAFLLQKADTAFLLQKKDTASLSNRIDLKANTTTLNNINTAISNKLIADTAYLLQKADTAFLLQKKDTAFLLQKNDTANLSNRIDLKANTTTLNNINTAINNKLIADTTYLLQKKDTASLSNRINLKANTIDVNNLYTSISNKLITDTTYLLQKKDTASLSNRINLKLDANKSGVANGVASLNALGKIPTDQIPAISFSSVRIVNTEAEMLGLNSAVVGSVAVRTDVNKSFILAVSDPTILTNWTMLLTPAPPVQSVNGYSGNVSLTKADIGLGNVDNYSSEDLPVSLASRNELALKLKITDTSYLFKKTDTSFLLQKKDTTILSNRINLKLTTTDTSFLLKKTDTSYLLKKTDSSFLLQKKDTTSLSNRINKKLNITDTSFLLKKTDTSFLLKKTDTSFLLKKSDTTYLLQKVDTTAILSMYAKKFTKDVVVNFGGGSFGKYANGETVPAKGKTLDEFLYDVLTKSVSPNYVAPRVSIGASPAFGAYEIGYNPGLVSLSNSYTKNDGGNVTLTIYNKGGASLGTGVNTNTPGTITSTVSYNVTVNYGAGNVKTDNLGNPYPTGQITAGSTSSASGAYTTYSKRYYGGTSVAFTESNTYNYASLSQALGSDPDGHINSKTVSLTPTGTQNVFFAYPAGLSDLSSILYNGNESIDSFTKSIILITNAQGYTQSYKVYVSKEVYSSTLNNLNIK